MVDFHRFLRHNARSGVQTYSLVGLNYTDADDLSVSVGASVGDPAAVSATFTIDELRQTFTISSPTVTAGQAIEILRATDNQPADRPVDWLAKTTPLTGADLNDSILHLLYIAQEAQDQAEELGRFSPYVGIFQSEWFGQGLQMKNLGAFTELTDAVRKDEMDAAIGSANNLPAVTGGDDDSSIIVVAGAWATTVPSSLRTAWGLGGAALLDAGDAASQLAQLDANGFLPAVDGQNLDLSLNTDVDTSGRRPAVVCSLSEVLPEFATNTTDSTWWFASSARWLLSGATRTEINCDQTVVRTDQVQANTALDLSAGTWLILVSAAMQQISGTPSHYFNMALVDDDNTGSATLWWEANAQTLPPPTTSDRLQLRPVNIGGEQQWHTFTAARVVTSSGLQQGGDGVTIRGRDSSSAAVTRWPFVRATAIKIAD